MSNTHKFEVRVNGWLGDHWAARFQGLHFQKTADGQTTIHGEVADEAALFGVLRSIEELGLTLVSIAAFPKEGGSR
ncbi:MAG: hypothetical protein ACLGH0_07405 [Thermoanaerobaculia bacterium]